MSEHPFEPLSPSVHRLSTPDGTPDNNAIPAHIPTSIIAGTCAMLLVAMGLIGFGLYEYWNAWGGFYETNRAVSTATGHVVDKVRETTTTRTGSNRRRRTQVNYSIVFAYEIVNGNGDLQAIQAEEEVPEDFYNRFTIGGEIPVEYLSNDPQVGHLAGNDAEIIRWIQTLGTVSVLALTWIIALCGVLFTADARAKYNIVRSAFMSSVVGVLVGAAVWFIFALGIKTPWMALWVQLAITAFLVPFGLLSLWFVLPMNAREWLWTVESYERSTARAQRTG